ncbi:MAG: MotA/TolQ/ExbB proton channel family protein [Crocinitomicaceae bacterium]|nr:MotA/TolQ/ExbB proton channel family protein [Crocinitomicaceae bacterium]
MTIFFLQSAPAGDASLDIFSLLMKGGVVMIPLVILSLIAVILIVERIMFFNKNLQLSEKNFSELIKHVEAGKMEEAMSLCEREKNSWGRIFIYGMTAESGNADEMDKLMEGAAEVEIGRLEKGLNYLSIIAGVAPLLGFIGTIAGVITIFFDISTSSDISISVISEGLYKKMVSSASGLVIGIIAFTAYHLFQNSIDSFISKVQEESLNLRVAILSKKKGA